MLNAIDVTVPMKGMGLIGEGSGLTSEDKNAEGKPVIQILRDKVLHKMNMIIKENTKEYVLLSPLQPQRDIFAALQNQILDQLVQTGAPSGFNFNMPALLVLNTFGLFKPGQSHLYPQLSRPRENRGDVETDHGSTLREGGEQVGHSKEESHLIRECRSRDVALTGHELQTAGNVIQPGGSRHYPYSLELQSFNRCASTIGSTRC